MTLHRVTAAILSVTWRHTARQHTAESDPCTSAAVHLRLTRAGGHLIQPCSNTSLTPGGGLADLTEGEPPSDLASCRSLTPFLQCSDRGLA